MQRWGELNEGHEGGLWLAFCQVTGVLLMAAFRDHPPCARHRPVRCPVRARSK